MGKSESRQRQELVGLRLTTQEKAAVEAHADTLGLTITSLIRVQLGLEPQPATLTVAVDGLADKIAEACFEQIFHGPVYPPPSSTIQRRLADDILDLLHSLAVGS